MNGRVDDIIDAFRYEIEHDHNGDYVYDGYGQEYVDYHYDELSMLMGKRKAQSEPVVYDVLQATDFVYRALSDKQDAQDQCGNGGIVAFWNKDNEDKNVATHVGPGSKSGYKGDWFISFTRELNIALTKYKTGKNRVIRVSIGSIPPDCKIHDFTQEQERHKHLKTQAGQDYTMAQNFAKKDAEVVVWCNWETTPGIPCEYVPVSSQQGMKMQLCNICVCACLIIKISVYF